MCYNKAKNVKYNVSLLFYVCRNALCYFIFYSIMVSVRVKRKRWSCGWPVRAMCTPWRPRPRRPRRTLPQNSGKWAITLFGLLPFLFFAASVAAAAAADVDTAAAAAVTAEDAGVEATAESDDAATAETAAAAKAALQYLQGAGIQTRDSATLAPCGH